MQSGDLTAQLDRRLEDIRRGLAADGYELLVDVADEHVLVRVRATPDACEDCLVPKPIFRDIVASALGGQIPAEQVEISYPGEETVPAPAAPDDGAATVDTTGFSARRRTISGWDEMQRLSLEEGWGDGLPVVPPTPGRVRAHLAAAELEADDVVAEASERNVVFRAEQIAINAVMAGARPEHMPVLVGAIRAICEPRFRFNHLASLGSPWPLCIVSGPLAQRIGMHHGLYLFGPESPVNAMLSRAFSFTMRNVAFARNGGIQRGQWGNPVRWQSFLTEDPDSPWGTLSTDLGHPPDATTLTAVSVYPSAPLHVSLVGTDAQRILDTTCHSIAHFGGAQYTKGTYVLMIGPHYARALHDQGWTRADVRRYVLDNTRTSLADLKRRSALAWAAAEATTENVTVAPGDEDTQIFLFQSNGDLDELVWIPSAAEGREVDVIPVVCGGDAGRRMAVAVPYQLSSNPVTRRIDA